MEKLRAWLRSSRGLVILFVLVTILPAAALVVLGLRLLEQERELDLAEVHLIRGKGSSNSKTTKGVCELIRSGCGTPLPR